ncbi:hypothetical protein P7C70_g7308, partial [Phenoliferia sp. Uapishka_3]
MSQSHSAGYPSRAQHSRGRSGEISVDELQRIALQNLYLGSPHQQPALPPPPHQHSSTSFDQSYSLPSQQQPPFALRSEDLALHNQCQFNPYSHSPAQLAPTNPQPINTLGRPTQSSPYYDSNSFDTFDAFDSASYNQLGAYTPSYGSWQSSYGDSFPSAPSLPSSNPSSVGGYDPDHARQQFQELSYSQYPSPYFSQPSYHDSSSGGPTDEQLFAPVGERMCDAQDWGLEGMEGLEKSSEMSDERGASGSQLDAGATLMPSDRQLQREHHKAEIDAQQSPRPYTESKLSAFAAHLSESPPKSDGGFMSHEHSRASPQGLPLLSIPTTGPTPSLNLTEPTPNTARPTLRKGQGTLDLERAFGMLVKNEDDRDNQYVLLDGRTAIGKRHRGSVRQPRRGGALYTVHSQVSF